jgi:hypothetical protein
MRVKVINKSVFDIHSVPMLYLRSPYSVVYGLKEGWVTTKNGYRTIKKLLKEELGNRHLLLFKDGTKGKLGDYQCFPVRFEESYTEGRFFCYIRYFI